ncbi:MAG TPA: CBS domain-containing protein [Symbiobacteriaceae bacterium]|nr:CBS domain-containing protein [Symbiobacteriaceae bacterium]
MTTARDLMKPCPCIQETATVKEIVEKLAGDDQALVVVDSQGDLQGIVTEFDLVKLIHQAADYDFEDGVVGGGLPAYLGMSVEELKVLTAGDIMTRDPDTVPLDMSLEDLAETMFRNRRKVILVAEDGRFQGMIQRMDLVKSVLG